MCAISARVRPNRRARPTKASRPSVPAGYRRYPDALRLGAGTIPRASYKRSALRLTPLVADTSPARNQSGML